MLYSVNYIMAAWLQPLFTVFEAAFIIFILRRKFDWKEAWLSLFIGLPLPYVSSLVSLGISNVFTDVYPLRWLWEHRLFNFPERNLGTLLLLFLVMDFTYYWSHRAAHNIRWLWANHSVHHSSTKFTLVSAYRMGWLDKITGRFVFFLPIAFLGFRPMMIFGVFSFVLTYQFWTHTELIRRMPKWFEFLLVTPMNHRVHHGIYPASSGYNFGGVLAIWDRIFKTYREEAPGEVMNYGLFNQVHTGNPIKVLFFDYMELGRDLRSAKSMKEIFLYVFGRPGWKPASIAGLAVQEKSA